MSEGKSSKGLETDAKKEAIRRKSAFVSKTKERGMGDFTHGAQSEVVILA